MCTPLQAVTEQKMFFVDQKNNVSLLICMHNHFLSCRILQSKENDQHVEGCIKCQAVANEIFSSHRYFQTL